MGPALCFLLALSVLRRAGAGPLGLLPNVTSSDLGIKEGTCALGDVVYMPGDEFPGSGPCERCRCEAGGVACQRQRCEPRPGCKALHRPDHCCPTYQCECEQEGRVYGNGEKLVDPSDPCRVCYCQGGEVVCRRIACFVRDDCTPRVVPGRCCPEYDNCPLRGVTTVFGVAPTVTTTGADDTSGPPAAPPSPAPPAPALQENVKQEITIKEITPVSEIPVITEVKIKEILPSSSNENVEYSSSKSPLIVREASTEKSVDEPEPQTEAPVVIEAQYSSLTPVSVQPPLHANIYEHSPESDDNNEFLPVSTSISTPGTIDSGSYSPAVTRLSTDGIPSNTPYTVPIKMEDEDPTMFEHNPAFPPLPDDLSVLRNHDDEIVSDLAPDNDHVSPPHDAVSTSEARTTAAEISREVLTTTPRAEIISIMVTERVPEVFTESSTAKIPITTISESTGGTASSGVKGSPMLNLRSAILTEILNVPSLIPDDTTDEVDSVTEDNNVTEELTPVSSLVTDGMSTVDETPTEKQKLLDVTMIENSKPLDTTVMMPEFETISTVTSPEMTLQQSSLKPTQEQSITSTTTSNVGTVSTETSSLNTGPSTESSTKVSTSHPIGEPRVDADTTKMTPVDSEAITVSKSMPSTSENDSFENLETTEFVLTSFSSSESATDAVEFIKISADPAKSEAIIESGRNKNTVLTDFINLVGDVAAIGDHTESPDAAATPTNPAIISESDELIPVNVGYKSKNKNYNFNSITEAPSKSKTQSAGNKQKVVEIEGEDSDPVTDFPPPHDKVEPTTRRPLIDTVSDDKVDHSNSTDTKDIEIINSYVPIINRRPTKVVMRKGDNGPDTEEAGLDSASSVPSTSPVSASAHTSAPLSTSAPVSKPASTSSPDTKADFASVPVSWSDSASAPVSTIASTSAPVFKSNPSSAPVSMPASTSAPFSSPAATSRPVRPPPLAPVHAAAATPQ